MTKRSGLGNRLWVHGYDLSNDTTELGAIQGGPAVAEVTGIDKSAVERLGLKRDGSIEASSVFNPATDRQHAVLSALPRADRVVTFAMGATAGEPAASLVSKQIGYDGERDEDGLLTFEVAAQGNGYGLSWGVLLTDGAVDLSGAGNVDSVDLGSALGEAHDAVGFLHVVEFTGTDATVAIQASSDDGSGDAFADRIVFGEITSGPTAERATMTSPATEFERYARVAVTTDSGFTSLTIAVALLRHDHAVVY